MFPEYLLHDNNQNVRGKLGDWFINAKNFLFKNVWSQRIMQMSVKPCRHKVAVYCVVLFIYVLYKVVSVSILSVHIDAFLQ